MRRRDTGAAIGAGEGEGEGEGEGKGEGESEGNRGGVCRVGSRTRSASVPEDPSSSDGTRDAILYALVRRAFNKYKSYLYSCA